MNARYLAMPLLLALMSQTAFAQGRQGRNGSGRAGASRRSSGGPTVSSHRSAGRSPAVRPSVRFAVTSRHPRPGIGRGTFSRSYTRPYYRSYSSYFRPRIYSSLYLGRPYYYDSFYYGGYYPAYYPPYTPPYLDYDSGYRAPGAYEVDDRYAGAGLERDRYDRERYDDRDSGRLRLEVRPSDATIYVDGEFHGSARQVTALPVAQGRHKVEVVRPGFRTEERDVDVARGETRVVSIELQRR